MKNKLIYLLVGVIFSGFTAFAQDDTSAKDTVDTDALKPEAGDIGIGVSAIPYLNYLGNFFGKEDDNDLNLGAQTLYFKYFLTDASAIRAAVYINNSTSKTNAYSQDDAAIAADPVSTAQVEDSRKINSNNMSLTVGYEMRKNRNRFAFLYGANVGYGFYSYKQEFSYGNPISALNPNPSNNFDDPMTDGRMLYSDNGITHSVSAGLFAGIEFFIAKKFSVGADFSLAYGYNWGSQADATYEQWDGTQVYEYDRPTSPGNSSSNLRTNQYSSSTAAGTIYVLFYF